MSALKRVMSLNMRTGNICRFVRLACALDVARAIPNHRNCANHLKFVELAGQRSFASIRINSDFSGPGLDIDAFNSMKPDGQRSS
jgi:hypothetical protein